MAGAAAYSIRTGRHGDKTKAKADGKPDAGNDATCLGALRKECVPKMFGTQNHEGGVMFRLTIQNEQHQLVFSGYYADRRNAVKTMFARCADCRFEALNDQATDFELARWNWLYWRNAGHASIVQLQ